MSEQAQYDKHNTKQMNELIRRLETAQIIEHGLEQISQLVNELEKNLKERGIIWVQ